MPPATRVHDSIAERLGRLRSTALSDPAGARDATWEWITELGRGTRVDRADCLFRLGELFAAGSVPRGLDGPTEGRLVAWATRPLPDRALSLVTDLWLPWVGKRFDVASATGDNLMAAPVRLVGRLVWPMYSFGSFEGKTSGFRFTTWEEKGKIDNGTDVLVIDYDSVPSNPRLAIRSVRDELVEIVPGANLGKMLWRTGNGDSARYSLLAYFALRTAVDEG